MNYVHNNELGKSRLKDCDKQANLDDDGFSQNNDSKDKDTDWN